MKSARINVQSAKTAFQLTIPTTQLPLLVAWVGVMIALPIVDWIGGESATVVGISVGVLFQFVAVISVVAAAWGWQRAATTVVVVAVISWAIEFVGSQTGFPFGVYDYTDKLQPQLGHVPLLIPLAWMMMLPPVWAIAQRITGSFRQQGATWRSRAAFVVVAALSFTAWDLFLDPQMVAWDLWRWADPGGDFPASYFGIPWVNYGGWFLSAAILTLAVRPSALPTAPLLLIYAITWALETIGLAFFWGLAGPALFGFVGMGGMLVWAMRSEM